jgi:hypothetical protein
MPKAKEEAVERYKAVEDHQVDLFTDTEEWKKEWVGMPEFVQDKQDCYSEIRVRFSSQEDLEDFSRLIGQKLTKQTKSIWHPTLIRGINTGKRWRDES